MWALPTPSRQQGEGKEKMPRTAQAGGMCGPSPDPDSRSQIFTKVSCLKGRGQDWRVPPESMSGRTLGFTIPVSCFIDELISPQPTTKRQLEGPQQLLGSVFTCQGTQI